VSDVLDPNLRLYACTYSAAKVVSGTRTEAPLCVLVLFAPSEAAAEQFAMRTAAVRFPEASGYFAHKAGAVRVPDIMVYAACAALAPSACGGLSV